MDLQFGVLCSINTAQPLQFSLANIVSHRTQPREGVELQFSFSTTADGSIFNPPKLCLHSIDVIVLIKHKMVWLDTHDHTFL